MTTNVTQIFNCNFFSKCYLSTTAKLDALSFMFYSRLDLLLKENCTQNDLYGESIFKRIFRMLRFVISLKNNFVSKFGSQHRGAELGCQRMFLELMT